MEQACKHQSAAWSLGRWFGLIGAVVVLYVLSSGPAVYLRERGFVSKQVVITIYAPLIGVDSDRLDSYIHWWAEKGRKK